MNEAHARKEKQYELEDCHRVEHGTQNDNDLTRAQKQQTQIANGEPEKQTKKKAYHSSLVHIDNCLHTYGHSRVH